MSSPQFHIPKFQYHRPLLQYKYHRSFQSPTRRSNHQRLLLPDPHHINLSFGFHPSDTAIPAYQITYVSKIGTPIELNTPTKSRRKNSSTFANPVHAYANPSSFRSSSHSLDSSSTPVDLVRPCSAGATGEYLVLLGAVQADQVPDQAVV